jgi:MFS family permease
MLGEMRVAQLTSRARNFVFQFGPDVGRIIVHSLLFGLSASIAEVLLNFYLVSMGYGTDAAGLFSTVARVAAVALGLPIGMLIDRSGAQLTLTLGLLGYVFGWILLLVLPAVAPGQLWLLLGAQFLAGGAQILAQTAVVPLLTSATTEEQRPMLFGWNASAAMVIGLLGSVLAGILPGMVAQVRAIGPQDTLAYALALVSVVVIGLLAIMPLVKPIVPLVLLQRTDVQDQPVSLLPTLQLARFALPSFFLGVGGGLFLPFQNLFFRNTFTLSDATVGLILGGAAFSMGLGGVIGGPVSQRMGLRSAAAWLRLGVAPAMALMLVPWLPLVIVGFFFRGMFVAASFPLNDALVMQSVPVRQRGLAMSMMSVLWSLGWGASAAVSGWMQLRYGFTPILIAAGIAYVVSGLFIFATGQVRATPESSAA